MKEDGESTNNNTNGKHTWRRGMFTTGYWSTIKSKQSQRRPMRARMTQNNCSTLSTTLPWAKHLTPCQKVKMDAQLAGEFASFFLHKIKKIRLQFQNTDQYILEVNASVPRLQDVLPLTNEEIEREILSMNSKTCEIDAIPTYLI